MKHFKLLALSISALIMSMPAANAGDVYACGIPEPAALSTETDGFCDIYTRQLAYRIEANKLRELIAERQKNFQAPAKAARDQYRQALIELNEQRGSAQD